MKEYNVFSNICETRKDFYLKRLSNCFEIINQNSKLKDNTNFYAIVDGIIDEEYINKNFSNLKYVKFINNEKILGIKSNTHYFPGWKRSFKVGLELLKDVNKLLYIDNDTKIINLDKIINYLDILNKNFSSNINSFIKSSAHLETSLLIINDKESRRKMIDYYNDDKNIFNMTGLITEDQVNLCLKPEIVFKSDRIKKCDIKKYNVSDLDFIAAYWHSEA